MSKKEIHKRHSSIVTTTPDTLECKNEHVIAKDFIPYKDRLKGLIKNVEALSAKEAKRCLKEAVQSYSDRHRNYEDILKRNFELAAEFAPIPASFSDTKKLVLGAYCTHEYSIEAAALFNPSIVAHPDQSGVKDGELRFVMSLRATGEGHISSIVFRTGIIDQDGKVSFDPNNRFFEIPKLRDDTIRDKDLFVKQLYDQGVSEEVVSSIFDNLGETFTKTELAKQIESLKMNDVFRAAHNDNALLKIALLLEVNYDIEFSAESDICERVIFPTSPDEDNGIEDARFVQFTDDNGKVTYYATYTAYSKPDIQPKLIETKDFITFKIRTLSGDAAINKGFALFPRKINGRYAMLSRQDGEHNYIMFSDDLYRWDKAEPLQNPEKPYWTFIQGGNCGSPIETDAGWLMITHGVGMMREYCIGATLLDINDPSQIISHFEKPLLAPKEGEREGYVPNVLYSCGALIHNETLILPYAASDQRCLVATIRSDELLQLLNTSPKTKTGNSSRKKVPSPG